VIWIIQTRFSGREGFAAVLQQHPLKADTTETLQQYYPRTAAVIRKR